MEREQEEGQRKNFLMGSKMTSRLLILTNSLKLTGDDGVKLLRQL